ncbi:MAG: hypothetical protein ACREXX_06435, partial [Gammaproteobacteria bacterium]
MEPRSSIPLFDPDAQAALHAELAAAARTPALRPLVLDPQPDLGPRFVGYWRQLSALPRRTRRSLQRRWKRSLAAIALLMALGQVPALAATIAVDGSTCTLVDAITAANTDAPTGGCTAGSGADTLELVPGSTHGLTAIADTTYGYGASGLPLVTSKITIAGHGSTIERPVPDPQFRLLSVSATGDLTLQHLTLRGGRSSYVGGGVLNRGGTLSISNSTVSGNTTLYDGGGVANEGGAFTISHSTVSGNFAYFGGGVDSSGTLTISHSTVSDNAAAGGYFGRCGVGGGVFNSRTLTISNSTVSGNATGGGSCYWQGAGGGVFNSGTFTLTDSTLSGNTAHHGVGGRGIYGGPGVGGGVHNHGTLTVTNSTISDNRAEDFDEDPAFGGGPGVGGMSNSGTLVLTHSTISDNVGGGVQNGLSPFSTGHTLTLDRTLVSGNAPTEVINLDGNTVIANAFNLFGLNGAAGVSGFSPGPRDIVPAGPLGDILAPLADNGGPTETHALV